METNIQHKEQLQYAEVYISDMLALKNIFLQTQKAQKVNPDFGVPFLLARKKNEITSFAGLVINEDGKIGFKVYDKKEMTESEKNVFKAQVEDYFKKNNTSNFRNPEQLKSSISSMIGWLNLS